jgi:hypothetical protein
MASPRCACISFGLDLGTKLALAYITERKGRSMAGMVEWLVRNHCKRKRLRQPLPDLLSPAARAQVVCFGAAAKPKAPRMIGRPQTKVMSCDLPH